MITISYIKTQKKMRLTCESLLFSQIREFFSVKDEKAVHARRRNRFARSRKYIITPTGIFNVGVFNEIVDYIRRELPTHELCIDDTAIKRLNIGKDTQIFTDFNIDLRDYQLNVVDKAFKAGTGVIVLGTGAGKTFTTAALIENHYRSCINKETFKCLVLVPTLDLVQQTYTEFQELGITFNCTMWTGKVSPDVNANVFIMNNAIFQSKYTQTDWLEYIDLLIVDECHKIQSTNSISKLITKILTPNKYGFTGTLPEDIYEKWTITGILGPVLHEMSSYELRNLNYLTTVDVKVLRLCYSGKLPKEYREELDFIYKHTERNNFIGKLSTKLNNNTLILVNHIEHGNILHETISRYAVECDKQVFFIQGSVDVNVRDEIKRKMEADTNVICIAVSAIFSTGVNIKNLHNIIFAAGGKSFIRTVQSIGRGLRLHKSKDKLIIFDIVDNLKYGEQHGIKRRDIYNKEKIPFNVKSITI